MPTICGINIPHENHYPNPIASSRIHEEAEKIETSLPTFDTANMVEKLRMTHESAIGILQAIDLGEPKDFEGMEISQSIVEHDLKILIDDIERICQTVIAHLATIDGQFQWNTETALWDGTADMIPQLCQELTLSTDQMRTRIAKIIEERKALSQLLENTLPLPAPINAIIIGLL
jgi:hypothetical protein